MYAGTSEITDVPAFFYSEGKNQTVFIACDMRGSPLRK
jgi:hypothetical protein